MLAVGAKLRKIKEYINSCFNVNIQDQNERALIHCAVSNGHLEIVKILINAGADLEVKDRNDATALHYAVRFGFIDIVEYLLEQGASIQSQSMYGDTPLHNAVGVAEYINIVKVLIDAGSDVNALDYHGNTPLYYALYHKNTEAMELLLNAGANPFLLNRNQETIFDQLAYVEDQDRSDYKEIIIFLFKHMNYGKYRKQFNISHKAYLKAWNIVCSEDNREILIRYADGVTCKNPTHPFQRLYRSKKNLC